MSRQLKPQKVDEVCSPSRRVRVDLMLDRNHLDFFAIVGPNEVRAPSIAELKPLAINLAATSEKYTWEGLILVTIGQSWAEKHASPAWMGVRRENELPPTGAIAQVSFERIERSADPLHPGKWVERPHTLDFEAKDPAKHVRDERERFKDVTGHYVDEAKTALPYSDETWKGLHAIRAAIDELHTRLTNLVERKDVVELLKRAASSKQPLLLAAKEGA